MKTLFYGDRKVFMPHYGVGYFYSNIVGQGAHNSMKFKGQNFVLLFSVRTKTKTLFKTYITLELEFQK